MKKSKVFQIAAVIAFIFPVISSALPAFPGAEGWGKNSRGGRSGLQIGSNTYPSRVVHVTNLNASGPGSFAAGFVTGSRTKTEVSQSSAGG